MHSTRKRRLSNCKP